MGASFCILNEPTLDRPSVGGDAHAAKQVPLGYPARRPFYHRTSCPFVGGDALIAPPRPQARKTPPPSVREVSRLRRDGGRDGRGRTPPLRTSTERAPRSFPVIPRSEATWESVLFFMPSARGTFALGGKSTQKRRSNLRFENPLRGFTRHLS